MSRRRGPTPRHRHRSLSPLPAEAGAALSLAQGDVQKLIQQLPPSDDLLEYYRAKTDQFQRRLEGLTDRLDQYRAAVEDAHELQEQLTARDTELSQLQQAISDMQVYVFQERDQVLRLHSENDRLKIQEVEDRRKIDVLLSLSGTTESSLTYFIKELDEGKLVRQHLPPQLKEFAKELNRKNRLDAGDGDVDAKPVPDAATLQLELGCVRAQLEERTRLAREERQALLDDRRVSAEERQAERAKRDQRLAAYNAKLHETQKLLYSASRDLLRMHSEHQQRERSWMAEKDQLLREREMLCQNLSVRLPARCERGSQAEPAPGRSAASGPDRADRPATANVAVMARANFQTAYQKLRQRATELMHQLEDANTRCAQYREQCTRLEKFVAEVRDARETDREEFKERLSRMRDSVLTMKNRYDELERRRRLEAEGFRSDVRLLRGDVRALERKLGKLTGQFFGDVDQHASREVWSQMSRNLGNTAKILEEIRRSKTQIYQLERELAGLWGTGQQAGR
ncbi:Coiled-coil domain-containing protein 77 [Amphibalanus amphitrite]|uniref:Coiled-coil domain-containing protein 77 n=1 Tax=Amphibalanus amphitrite TaxID=1232801 RepID=A0A6A4WB73_AMPAM|nr:Coiled-coil domain-containing protein 77 [Amphibalanus amphitrite]